MGFACRMGDLVLSVQGRTKWNLSCTVFGSVKGGYPLCGTNASTLSISSLRTLAIISLYFALLC